jgi:GNAT superfamily N-acetyltransferase
MAKQITTDIFFNEPNIVTRVSVMLRVRPSLEIIDAEPFMDNFTMKMNHNGGAVFDGDTLIASIGRFDNLTVHEDYRGQGIATELVYQMIAHNPDNLPARKATRTAWGAKAYQAAWTRYNTPEPTPEPIPGEEPVSP